MSRKDVEFFVVGKINRLIKESESSEGKSIMASLRRGVGKKPGEIPDTFGIILLDMPDSFLSRDGTPTKEEWSVYGALTLYALHQQGNNMTTHLMHQSDAGSIGTALSKLASTEGDVNAIGRMMQRLKALVNSSDVEGFIYHLRGCIQLFSREMIPLDYGNLAGDIYEFQNISKKSALGLRWGQDFYRYIGNNKKSV